MDDGDPCPVEFTDAKRSGMDDASDHTDGLISGKCRLTVSDTIDGMD